MPTIRAKAITEAKRVAKERDKYVCQKCGATSETRQIQGSHIIPVNAKGLIACDPYNIIALCSSCHKWAGDSWHEAPMEQKWFDDKFPGRYSELKKRHKPNVPIKKWQWQEEYEKLKDMKLKDIKE